MLLSWRKTLIQKYKFCLQPQSYSRHIYDWQFRSSISYVAFSYVYNVCTTFHAPSATGSLVTAIKPKAKEHFCTAAMLLFYFQHKSPYQRLHMPWRFIIAHHFRIRNEVSLVSLTLHKFAPSPCCNYRLQYCIGCYEENEYYRLESQRKNTEIWEHLSHAPLMCIRVGLRFAQPMYDIIKRRHRSAFVFLICWVGSTHEEYHLLGYDAV
jgi:hypothetical protein